MNNRKVLMTAKSLEGVWVTPNPCFLWNSLHIFRKLSSSHPHDYWVGYCGGACLGSSVMYGSARYDISNNQLKFSPSLSLMRYESGPFYYLESESKAPTKHLCTSTKYRSVSGYNEGNKEDEDGNTSVSYLISSAGYERLKIAGLITSSGEWSSGRDAVATYLGRAGDQFDGLVLSEVGREAAMRPTALSHGVSYYSSILKSKEQEELLKDNENILVTTNGIRYLPMSSNLL
jgi:hypothetical protein